MNSPVLCSTPASLSVLANTRSSRLLAQLLYRGPQLSPAPNVSYTRCDLLDAQGYERQRRALAQRYVSPSQLQTKSKKLIHWLRGGFGLLGAVAEAVYDASWPKSLDDDCAICMDQAGPGQVIQFKTCVHWVCATCLESLYNASQVGGAVRCPLCRAPVQVPGQCLRAVRPGFVKPRKENTNKIDVVKRLIHQSKTKFPQVILAYQSRATLDVLISNFPTATTISKRSANRRTRSQKRKRDDRSVDDDELEVILVPFEKLARGTTWTDPAAHVIFYELFPSTTAKHLHEWTSVLRCCQISALYTFQTIEEFIVRHGWNNLGSVYYQCDLQNEGPGFHSGQNVVSLL